MAETEKMDISYMGPIFKKYRVDANRTQEEVAEKVGTTARFLMALENEEKRPSIDILLRLVDTLNIPGASKSLFSITVSESLWDACQIASKHFRTSNGWHPKEVQPLP